ncbi:MAG: vWA domain-containing protein [Deltaproteobacteria bacterium]|nr:vWA domain-containing protein [Deltaproteobacteria bacterium]
MFKHFGCALVLLALTACPEPGKPIDTGRPGDDPDDLDGDGIANDEDSDVDGDDIPNASDFDIDGDLDPNAVDDDSDGDGIENAEDDTPFGANPDNLDGPFADPDKDGVPNINDPDDDDDGIPDGVFGGNDCNGDGIPEPEDADCDGFCLELEGGAIPCDDGAPPGSGAPDTDGDDIPDVLDPDDDNDGIPDGDDGNPSGGDPCFQLEGPPDPACFPVDPGEGEGEPGEGEGEGPPPGCRDDNFSVADPLAPRVLLVVDRSGSMNEDAAGFDGSKWDGAVETLDLVSHQLESTVELGLAMYPAGGGQDQQCTSGSLDEGVELNNADDITGALRATVAAGGTPTAPTLLVAAATLSALGSDGGQRAAILVTDGGPNCNESLNGQTCRCVSPNPSDCQAFSGNCLDDVNAIGAARQMNTLGFPVFVIAVPGAQSFNDVLTGMAQAGGTDNFFDANSANALAQQIEDIAVRLGGCRFDLPGSPDPNTIVVDVDGTAVGRDTNHQNGFDLVDADTVELFGTACEVATRAENVHIQSCL